MDFNLSARAQGLEHMAQGTGLRAQGTRTLTPSQHH